jgi:hypothetical protein
MSEVLISGWFSVVGGMRIVVPDANSSRLVGVEFGGGALCRSCSLQRRPYTPAQSPKTCDRKTLASFPRCVGGVCVRPALTLVWVRFPGSLLAFRLPPGSKTEGVIVGRGVRARNDWEQEDSLFDVRSVPVFSCSSRRPRGSANLRSVRRGVDLALMRPSFH